VGTHLRLVVVGRCCLHSGTNELQFFELLAAGAGGCADYLPVVRRSCTTNAQRIVAFVRGGGVVWKTSGRTALICAGVEAREHNCSQGIAGEYELDKR